MSDLFNHEDNPNVNPRTSVDELAEEARRRARLYNEKSEKKDESKAGETDEEVRRAEAYNEAQEKKASSDRYDREGEEKTPESHECRSGSGSSWWERGSEGSQKTENDNTYHFTGSGASGAGSGKTGKTPGKKGKAGWKKVLVIVLIVAVAGGVIGGGVVAVKSLVRKASSLASSVYEEAENEKDGSFSSEKPGISEVPSTDSQESFGSLDDDLSSYSGETMTVQEVASACMPAMVSITTQTVSEVQSYFGGGTQAYTKTGAGSGVIVEEEDGSLLILTNYHVISGSTTITASFCDDTAVEAEVAGYDSAEDLALIKVSLSDLSDDTIDNVRRITIGDTDECQVGESVVAIGNALGYGQSVSAGIISALNRQVTVDGVSHTLVQTDAAINPGNSGGALINMYGELIGINEVKYNSTSIEGMGYAIPTSTVNSFLNTILNRTERTEVDDSERGYLGVSCITVPDSYVEEGYPSGAYISEVTEGSPADEGGLQTGDIVSSVNGYSVSSADDLVEAVRCIKSGETASLTVLRLNDDQTAYESHNIDIVLTSYADSALAKSQAEEAESTPSEESEESSDSGSSFFMNPFTGNR